MRRLVIANVSAMQALDEGAGFYARPSQVRSPATFASTAAELHSFTALPSGCTVPIEALVGTKTRLNTNEWRASHRGSLLPPGSVLEIGQNRFLTSAEFFFLRTAPKLSVAQAVLLGMELCGYYSTLMSIPYREYCNALIRERKISLSDKPWPPSDWGMSLEHQRDLMKNGFITRYPHSTPESISRYLDGALSANSNSRALSAARLLLPNSHSPMESRLYARFCLPKLYGGFNLKPVELNGSIRLPHALAYATGIKDYSVDLLFRKAHLGIEYEGNPSHSGLSAAQKDRLKRNILESTGIRIISIDSKQYANEDMIELFAHDIAKGLGIADWQLKLTPKERLSRYALIDEMSSWDYDLYRPPYRR